MVFTVFDEFEKCELLVRIEFDMYVYIHIGLEIYPPTLESIGLSG